MSPEELSKKMKYLEKEFGISLELRGRPESDDDENLKKESFRLPLLPNLNSRNSIPHAPTKTKEKQPLLFPSLNQP
jgi:hypothetical protein